MCSRLDPRDDGDAGTARHKTRSRILSVSAFFFDAFASYVDHFLDIFRSPELLAESDLIVLSRDEYVFNFFGDKRVERRVVRHVLPAPVILT